MIQDTLAYIFAAISLLMFLSVFVDIGAPAVAKRGKAEKASRITEWRDINTADQLRSANADVYSTPFGNVGQHIGYRVTEKARRNMSRWDFDEKLEVTYALNHPRPRIDMGRVTHADVGGVAVIPVDSPLHDRSRSVDAGSDWDYNLLKAVDPRGRFWSMSFAALVFGVPSVLAILTNYGINAPAEMYCYPSVAFFVLAGLARAIGK